MPTKHHFVIPVPGWTAPVAFSLTEGDGETIWETVPEAGKCQIRVHTETARAKVVLVSPQNVVLKTVLVAAIEVTTVIGSMLTEALNRYDVYSLPGPLCPERAAHEPCGAGNCFNAGTQVAWTSATSHADW